MAGSEAHSSWEGIECPVCGRALGRVAAPSHVLFCNKFVLATWATVAITHPLLGLVGFFPHEAAMSGVGSAAAAAETGTGNPVTRAMLLVRGGSTGHGATLYQQQRLLGLIGPRTWRAVGSGFVVWWGGDPSRGAIGEDPLCPFSPLFAFFWQGGAQEPVPMPG